MPFFGGKAMKFRRIGEFAALLSIAATTFINTAFASCFSEENTENDASYKSYRWVKPVKTIPHMRLIFSVSQDSCSVANWSNDAAHRGIGFIHFDMDTHRTFVSGTCSVE
jgi:hypothetical protein